MRPESKTCACSMRVVAQPILLGPSGMSVAVFCTGCGEHLGRARTSRKSRLLSKRVGFGSRCVLVRLPGARRAPFLVKPGCRTFLLKSRSAGVGRNLAKLGLCRLKCVGRGGAIGPRFGPIPVDISVSGIEVGRCRFSLGGVWPEFGRYLPRLVESGPSQTQLGPDLRRLGRSRARSCEIIRDVARVRPRSGRS